MTQLIIEINRFGEWRKSYGAASFKPFSVVTPPRSMRGKDTIIGSIIDNRKAWRSRLDEHTKTADYEIIRL